MPVPEALARIQARSTGDWAQALRQARDEASAGASLAIALRKAERFPPLLVDGLEAAEDELPLLRLSELLERADLRQRQTALVLAYPLLLLVAGVGLTVILWLTVGRTIPAFLSDLHIPLSLPSRITVLILNLFANPLVASLLLAILVGLLWLLSGRGAAAAWRLRLPVVGSWIRRSETATWLEWIDYFLSHHRPVPEALRRAARACQDPAFRARAEAAAAKADQGLDLKSALAGQGILSELALWLVAHGQAQEFPQDYLGRAAQLLHRELEADAEGGLACLEVAGLLLVAVVAFPMILSIFLPLYNTIGSL
jgi:type II secretory pathway component PulF